MTRLDRTAIAVWATIILAAIAAGGMTAVIGMHNQVSAASDRGGQP
ncbi:hypothetical protein [Caulobacter sp. RL271]|uniref:Uncharacterized protein n=1 Tax=Caulobacter segnis TaxID=88688 RepID=A0ABY4ZZ58_9CAUL|nr:hypothetical protein [Caulobacter segnis]USQ97287.1 hypothetical protein MZV50_07010 [Caulobacter segnis]